MFGVKRKARLWVVIPAWYDNILMCKKGLSNLLRVSSKPFVSAKHPDDKIGFSISFCNVTLHIRLHPRSTSNRPIQTESSLISNTPALEHTFFLYSYCYSFHLNSTFILVYAILTVIAGSISCLWGNKFFMCVFWFSFYSSVCPIDRLSPALTMTLPDGLLIKDFTHICINLPWKFVKNIWCNSSIHLK